MDWPVNKFFRFLQAVVHGDKIWDKILSCLKIHDCVYRKILCMSERNTRNGTHFRDFESRIVSSQFFFGIILFLFFPIWMALNDRKNKLILIFSSALFSTLKRKCQITLWLVNYPFVICTWVNADSKLSHAQSCTGQFGFCLHTERVKKRKCDIEVETKLLIQHKGFLEKRKWWQHLAICEQE